MDKKYLIGLTLILISFVACVVSFYLIIFVFPIFLIGAIFVFISQASMARKILITILPILLWFPATYVFLMLYNYTSPKTFLIEADYEGILRIVYEKKCGIMPQKEAGRQILKFPATGILILNRKFDGGINNNYYLVDKKGNRIKVNEVLDFKDRKKNSPAIEVGGSGILGSQEEEITYSDFYLYNGNTTLSDNYKFSERFDSMTVEIVKSCRTK